MHRSFCRHTLESGAKKADAIYKIRITSSNLVEKTVEASKYYSCPYDIEIVEVLKQPRYNRIFGTPEITKLVEVGGRGSSFDGNSFWSEGATCKPVGNYLLFAQLDRLKELQKRQAIGNCNQWVIVSDSYTDDVRKIINDKSR